MVEWNGDAVAVCTSVAVLLAYGALVVFLAWRRPASMAYAVHRKVRLLWVRGVMRDRSKDVMAVQTLRNYVMAATFKASSAVLLLIGTLTLSAQVDHLAKAWHVLSPAAGLQGDWWIAKLVCLLSTLIIAFFAFAMVIRNLNHVLFMIGLPTSDAQGDLAPERIAMRLNQAGTFYTLGMRAFFLTVPLVFWFFGPLFLVGATVVTVSIFHVLDQSPSPGSGSTT